MPRCHSATLNDEEEKELWRLSASPFFTPAFISKMKYYELLDRVRTHGDWETWIDFFLTCVKETAQQAADTSREILTLIEKDRRTIEKLGRPAGSVLRVHLHLQRKPIITIPATAEQLSLCAYCGEGFAAHGEARHGSRNDRQTAPSPVHVSPLPRNSQPGHRTAKSKSLTTRAQADGYVVPAYARLNESDLTVEITLLFGVEL
jgi:hypothetical protein